MESHHKSTVAATGTGSRFVRIFFDGLAVMFIVPTMLLLYYGFFHLYNLLMGLLCTVALIWLFKKRKAPIFVRAIVIVSIWGFVAAYMLYPKPVTQTVMNGDVPLPGQARTSPLYVNETFYCSGIPRRTINHSSCIGRSYEKDGTPRPAHLDYYLFGGRRAEPPMPS